MNSLRHFNLASALCWTGVLSAAAAAQTYSVITVDPFPGDDSPTYAWDINNAGHIFGTAYSDGNRLSRCFTWQNGSQTLIAAEDNHPFIWSGAINDADTLVGMAMVTNIIGTTRSSFVTSAPFLPDLFPLFPSAFSSGTTDMNDTVPPWAVGTLTQDQQIGTAGFSIWHAYLVFVDGNPNPAQDLGTLGGLYSRAEAVNDARDVVGGSFTSGGGMHAFLRSGAGGPMQDLGTLGGSTSHAFDINNATKVVGRSRLADGSTHAFAFQNNQMTSLGTLGGFHSEALDVSNDGTVVGMSFNAASKPRAFLHDGNAMIDLNARIPPGTGWVLQYANSINDSGWIVGWGRREGETRGFLLKPRLPGDATGDGAVNVDDLLAVINAWGACQISPGICWSDLAPLNGDGLVNVDDLLAVINNWGLR